MNAEPCDKWMQYKYSGTGHHLGLNNLLGCQIVVGGDESCICPHTWYQPPVAMTVLFVVLLVCS